MNIAIPTVDDGPALIAWVVSRAADIELILTVTDEETGDPVDLSTVTFAGTIKATPDRDADEIAALTVTGTDQGQLFISAANSDMEIPDDAGYVFSVWQTDPTRKPWVQGPLTVEDNLL
jgi:hypothetical protein